MEGASCPNCRGTMELMRLESAHPSVEIDVCFTCHAFWFDRLESPALMHRGVLELFQTIREHRDAPRQTIGARLGCPRCRKSLVRTQDFQGTNRLEYFRCPDGDGRFTTFFQFLREKRFVRSLTPAEMTQLRVEVSQVRCSSCGAVVTLEKDAACQHCGAAVSILDADAMEKTLIELKSAAAKPSYRDAPGSRPVEGAVSPEGMRVLRQRMHDRVFHPRSSGDSTYDILSEAIDSIAGWLIR